MDSIASINNHKKNFFEFELVIDGLDAEDAEARFVIKFQPDFHLSFPCEFDESKSKWSVELPPIPMLEKTAYNWCIEVMVDGYFFEGAKGMLNVIGAPDVYIKKKSDKPAAKKPEPKTESKIPVPERNDDRTKTREKSVRQLAKEMMEKQTKEATNEKKPVVTETKKPETKKPVPTKTADRKVNEDKKPAAKKPVVEKKAEPKKVEPKKPIIKEDKSTKVEPKKTDKPLIAPDEMKKIIKESTVKPAEPKVTKKAAPKKPVAKKPVQKKPEPKPEPKLSEKDIAAKQLLESLEPKKEEAQPEPKKKIALKKGEQVVR